MDYAQLKTAILANTDCQPYIITNDMPKDRNYYVKDSAIADIFNAQSGARIVERFENDIGIMSALGAVSGATILEKLEQAATSNTVLKWALRAIKSDTGINIGDPETQTMLDGLVANNILTDVEATSIKNLAVQPSSLAYQTVGQPITAADVSIALRNY